MTNEGAKKIDAFEKTEIAELHAEIQNIDEQHKRLVERRFSWLVDWSASLPLSNVVTEYGAELEDEIRNLDELKLRLKLRLEIAELAFLIESAPEDRKNGIDWPADLEERGERKLVELTEKLAALV